MSSKKKLLAELCVKQRKHKCEKYQMKINDLTRFLKHINSSIFNTNECVLWTGSLTKCNSGKSHYVNYYLNKRKLALHRILYINFVDDLENKHYLKYTCDNPGICCNIKHFIKVSDENEIIADIDVQTTVKEVKIPDNVIIRKLSTPGQPCNKIIIVFND